MSSRKTAGRRGTTKKRAQRATSNVFAMFNQDQIQEFKEAFNMIDQNRDGFIDHEDLHDMLASLGKDPTEDYLEGMMGEAPGPINFTMFLTMFGERLQVGPTVNTKLRTLNLSLTYSGNGPRGRDQERVRLLRRG